MATPALMTGLAPGSVAIAAKDKLKLRLGRSPNGADARAPFLAAAARWGMMFALLTP